MYMSIPLHHIVLTMLEDVLCWYHADFVKITVNYRDFTKVIKCNF
jgi:hypothetical protein